MRAIHRNTLALPIALVLTMSSAAIANADSERCSADGDCAGKATFTSHGETFAVTDNKADGHSAVLLYWLPGEHGAKQVWASGNGTTVKKDLELDEGLAITYRVCIGEGGSADEVFSETCGVGFTDKT